MTAQEPQRSIVEELLVSTIYDWIDLGYVRSTVRELTRIPPSDLHPATMQVVAQLIRDGLVAAGNVTDGHFQAWDCTRDEAISRIDEAWRAAPDPELWPFQVAALAPTDAGVRIITEVLSREGEDDSWRERMSQSPIAVAHRSDGQIGPGGSSR